MSDASDAAMTEVEGLLALAASGPLDARACTRLAALAPTVPGRVRRIVEVFARQRDAAAVDAALELPRGTLGIVEAVFAALRHGSTRIAADGHAYPHMLALEFRSSGARRFPLLVERASAAFGPQLERIRVDGKLHYRFALFGDAARLRQRALQVELDVECLHRDLERLRGVRVWLNGWCFADDGAIAPRSRAALLRAWFEWARSRPPEHRD